MNTRVIFLDFFASLIHKVFLFYVESSPLKDTGIIINISYSVPECPEDRSPSLSGMVLEISKF